MKYLILCHNPFGTSTFSRISNHVIDYIVEKSNQSEDYIYCLANGTINSKYKNNCSINPIYDIENQLNDILEDFSPDVLVTIGDISETILPYYHKNSVYYTGWKWISILDIGSVPADPKLLEFVSLADHILTFNANSTHALSQIPHKNISYARPGVEKNLFYTLPNQKEIKQKYKSEGIFTVLSPGSNNEINQKISVIDAFSAFSKDKHNVYLYMCDRDGYGYFNAHDIAWKYPWIHDQLMISPKDKGISDHELNNLYNAANCLIDVCCRSNFSHSVLEAISCNIGNVFMQIGQNSLYQYPGDEDVITRIMSNRKPNNIGGDEYYVDVDDLTDLLEKEYDKTMSANKKEENLQNELKSIEWKNDKFSWNNFDEILEVILKKLLNIKEKETFSIKI